MLLWRVCLKAFHLDEQDSMVDSHKVTKSRGSPGENLALKFTESYTQHIETLLKNALLTHNSNFAISMFYLTHLLADRPRYLLVSVPDFYFPPLYM